MPRKRSIELIRKSPLRTLETGGDSFSLHLTTRTTHKKPVISSAIQTVVRGACLGASFTCFHELNPRAKIKETLENKTSDAQSTGRISGHGVHILFRHFTVNDCVCVGRAMGRVCVRQVCTIQITGFCQMHTIGLGILVLLFRLKPRRRDKRDSKLIFHAERTTDTHTHPTLIDGGAHRNVEDLQSSKSHIDYILKALF